LGKAVSTATNTWVPTPGPEIYLDYNTESGSKFSVASDERVAEARAAGLR